MSGDPVKTSEGGRRAQTRATRRRIVEAATHLFVEEGYGATTLAAVADRAGVAVQTVYFHMGNKRTLLKEVVDLAAAGDDEPVAVLEQPWMDRLREEPDPRRVIDMWVDNGRDLFVRIAPIMRVLRDAATTDPEVAAQWATNEEERLTAFAALVDVLDGRGGLRADLSADEATDLVFALNSVEVYLLLESRGWSPERWAAWLAPCLATTLLAP